MKKTCLLIVLTALIVSSCQTNATDAVWWKESIFYEIYMPSYKDSDGNGYSDFKGMSSQLDYLSDLNIGALWLTPFYPSPKVDNGYDVADYTNVDPQYGTLDDFKSFLDDAHERDIKVIIDMVVNHTSTDHYWFKEALKSKENSYRDYYIWKDSTNNWESLFGGSAWKHDAQSNQYYYHQFDERMADLNWSNPKVVEEIQNVLRFWLDLGVDGFRMDVINFLTTDGILKDNPTDSLGKQIHTFDIDQPSVGKAMATIASTIREYDNRFVVGEIGSDKIEVLKKYQGEEYLDVVFNFNFGSIAHFSAQRIYDELVSMEKNMSNYPTLFFGSHDMPRLKTRLAEGNDNRALTLAALMLTAKGVPFIYFGEEIGMESYVAKTYDNIVDIQAKTHYQMALDRGLSKEDALVYANKYNRDKSRTPMQWNDESYAGFSIAKPWINVHDNHDKVNVMAQKRSKTSILSCYKQLINVRNHEPTLAYGKYNELTIANDNISFSRSYNGDTICAQFNFSPQNTSLDIKESKILVGDNFLKSNDYIIYRK